MPPRPPFRALLAKPQVSCPHNFLRTFSTTRPRHQDAFTPTETSNARWLSQTKERIGKCIIFGLNEEQARKAGSVLKALGSEWRDLIAGREGFLVERKRAGLLR